MMTVLLVVLAVILVAAVVGVVFEIARGGVTGLLHVVCDSLGVLFGLLGEVLKALLGSGD